MWYLIVWHVLFYYFAWPYGQVWGNVWAVVPCAVLTGLAAWFMRHRLGRALIRFFHTHWLAHMAELEELKRKNGSTRNG